MYNYSREVTKQFHSIEKNGTFAKSEKNIKTAYVSVMDDKSVMQLQIKISNDYIIDTRFKAYGGVATIATCSWLANYLVDEPLSVLDEINSEMINEKLELNATTQYCAMQAEDLIKQLES